MVITCPSLDLGAEEMTSCLKESKKMRHKVKAFMCVSLTTRLSDERSNPIKLQGNETRLHEMKRTKAAMCNKTRMLMKRPNRSPRSSWKSI